MILCRTRSGTWMILEGPFHLRIYDSISLKIYMVSNSFSKNVLLSQVILKCYIQKQADLKNKLPNVINFITKFLFIRHLDIYLILVKIATAYTIYIYYAAVMFQVNCTPQYFMKKNTATFNNP